MKKQEFKKMKRGWGTSGTFKHPNHRGARKRRGRARNWKLIWTNNDWELPQFGEGSRVPRSLGSSESPKEIKSKNKHTNTHDKLPKFKYKERILKAAKEKETVTYRGVPIRLSADFSKETFKQEVVGKFSKSWKARTYIKEYSIQQSYHLEWKSR